MKRKNMTRNALVTSILSLLLCVSMLVGTTFAWFTDEVVSGMNTIAAGNLDVELLADGVEVKPDTKLFDLPAPNLWEPGVVVYEKLQVANVGTLALKYQMTLNFGGENDLNGHKLSEVLQVAVLEEGDVTNWSDRVAVLAAAKTAVADDQGKGALSNFYEVGELEAKTTSEAMYVVIFWEPNDNAKDNLYNANNNQTTSDGQPLHIELGINLQATQKMSESDSFGNDYDESASILPKATVNNTGAKTVPVLMGYHENEIALDTSFQFLPNETKDEGAVSEYANWHADYVIVADKDVPAGSVALAGYYKAWCGDNGWVVLSGPAVAANQEIRLVGDGLGVTVSYEEICMYGNDGTGFLCGATDLTGANAGTTITVELRMYETDETRGALSSMDSETGHYEVIGRISYTFGTVEVSTVAELEAAMAKYPARAIALRNCNEPTEVVDVPTTYTGTVTLDNCSVASVQGAGVVNLAIEGNVKIQNANGSAITGTEINVSGNGHLTATGKGKAAFGIGGMTTEKITISDVTIDYVEGGEAYGVGTDTKYYKDAPEGGAAIGSGYNGAEITLNDVNVVKAIGGSKAAAIGARYHVGVTVNITGSTIGYAEGGVSAAGIGSSRVSSDAAESGTTINITNSAVTAKGGVYGAGIGSGYDTHCLSKQPLCTINIDGSTINATGGQYAAGVGTGYHNAALAGEIKNSTVNAASGEKWYKDAYTSAMDVGFGVTDPTREGQQTDSKLLYNGTEITLATAPKYTWVADGLFEVEDNTYSVTSANGLETLNGMMVNKTAGKDVVINLNADIDFSGKTWTPVDSHADTAFTMKEINGNGHIISNLTINGQAMFKRFAGTGDVTIKDITFDKATVNSNSLNSSILTVQTYQNVLLDNVDVKNSSITGTYKVAPLIATVYNESSTSITATLKNCDVDTVTVTSTAFDFSTAGMVAFVYEGDNDKVVFENCTVSNVKLMAKPNGYSIHAWIYTNDANTDDCINEASGVTVTNCTFEVIS